MAILQAYVDDSGRGQRLFVLAGWIATAKRWASFSDAWKTLLNERPQLAEVKMRKLAKSKGGLRRAERFYRLIEQYVDAGFTYTIDTHLLARISREVFPESESNLAEQLDNPWDEALSHLVQAIARNQELLKIAGPVDFTFDEATEKARCLHAWEMFKLTDLTVTHLIGDVMFRSSEEVLPLQAGDLMAWWVGEWQRDGMIYGPLNHKDFWWPRVRRGLPWIHVVGNEASIRERLVGIRYQIRECGLVVPRLDPLPPIRSMPNKENDD